MSKFVDDVYKYVIENLENLDIQFYSDSERLDMASDCSAFATMFTQDYRNSDWPEISPRLHFSFAKYNDEEMAKDYLSDNLLDILKYMHGRPEAPNPYMAALNPDKYLHDAFLYAAENEMLNLLHMDCVIECNEYRSNPIIQEDINKLIWHIKMNKFEEFTPEQEREQRIARFNESVYCLVSKFKDESLSDKDIRKTLDGIVKTLDSVAKKQNSFCL